MRDAECVERNSAEANALLLLCPSIRRSGSMRLGESRQPPARGAEPPRLVS